MPPRVNPNKSRQQRGSPMPPPKPMPPMEASGAEHGMRAAGLSSSLPIALSRVHSITRQSVSRPSPRRRLLRD